MMRINLFFILSANMLFLAHLTGNAKTLSDEQIASFPSKFEDKCLETSYLFQPGYKLSTSQVQALCRCFGVETVKQIKDTDFQNPEKEKFTRDDLGQISEANVVAFDLCLGSVRSAQKKGPALAVSDSQKPKVQCKDYWNVEAQWKEMSETCAKGVQSGDPLSQVATAIHLLQSKDLESQRKAHELLLQAAASGYDDAYYWLGVSQSDPEQAVEFYEKAQGTGGFGQLALVEAAEMHFKGKGVPKNFKRARTVFKRAINQMARNSNKGIPKPPGEWWSNAKWYAGSNAILFRSIRYGYELKKIDGKYKVLEKEPQNDLSDKELYNAYGKMLDAKVKANNK